MKGLYANLIPPKGNTTEDPMRRLRDQFFAPSDRHVTAAPPVLVELINDWCLTVPTNREER